MIESMYHINIKNSTETVCWEEVEIGGVIIILLVVLVVFFLALGVIIFVRKTPICDCCQSSSLHRGKSVVAQGMRRGWGLVLTEGGRYIGGYWLD